MDSKFSEDPWKGPYTVIKVNDNGTVKLRMGKVPDNENICILGIIPLSLGVSEIYHSKVSTFQVL
jgi:hypothetical protein